MTPKQPRNVRARKMWLGRDGCVYTPFLRENSDKPVFVLPADAKSYERMREQVARAICSQQNGLAWNSAGLADQERICFLNDAAVVLSALGIHPPGMRKLP